MCVYIYTPIWPLHDIAIAKRVCCMAYKRGSEGVSPLASVRAYAACFSLYKRVFYFTALLWESIILVLPPPTTCKAYPTALLLHDCCAIYDPPSTPLLYAIHHTILAMTILCKGQRLLCRKDRCVTHWPLQDVRLLRGCCAQINNPFAPPTLLHCPP